MSSSTQIIDEGAVHSDSALAAYATLEKMTAKMGSGQDNILV